MTQMYIIAGGPGDPDLITVKGRKIIETADIVFASPKFFNDGMFAMQKEDCRFYETFDITHDERMAIIEEGVARGLTVAYVCMGDPCLYGGGIQGLIDRLEVRGIDFEIIPGVSAFNSACAVVKKQMTGLGLPNTAICTTYRDKPDVEEYLDRIAALQASVALFMSVENLDSVCEVFLRHYAPDTPVVIVSKASQTEQRLVYGDLTDIKQRASEQGVEDGLILLGEFLDTPFDYGLERQFEERKRQGKMRNHA